MHSGMPLKNDAEPRPMNILTTELHVNTMNDKVGQIVLALIRYLNTYS